MSPTRLDARGLLCPLPVLKARKALAALAPGTELELLADDRMAEVDVPHFCAEQGHEFLGRAGAPGGGALYRIRRGGRT